MTQLSPIPVSHNCHRLHVLPFIATSSSTRAKRVRCQSCYQNELLLRHFDRRALDRFWVVLLSHFCCCHCPIVSHYCSGSCTSSRWELNWTSCPATKMSVACLMSFARNILRSDFYNRFWTTRPFLTSSARLARFTRRWSPSVHLFTEPLFPVA